LTRYFSSAHKYLVTSACLCRLKNRWKYTKIDSRDRKIRCLFITEINAIERAFYTHIISDMR